MTYTGRNHILLFLGRPCRQIWEAAGALVHALPRVARHLACLAAAREGLVALAAAANIREVARLVEGHPCVVRRAVLRHGLGAWRARVVGVAVVVRAVAAGARHNAWVVALRGARAARDRGIDNRAAAAAVQRVDANVGAWRAGAGVAQLAALVNAAWGLFTACLHANMPFVFAALLLALVAAAREGVAAALFALEGVIADHALDNLPREAARLR